MARPITNAASLVSRLEKEGTGIAKLAILRAALDTGIEDAASLMAACHDRLPAGTVNKACRVMGTTIDEILADDIGVVEPASTGSTEDPPPPVFEITDDMTRTEYADDASGWRAWFVDADGAVVGFEDLEGETFGLHDPRASEAPRPEPVEPEGGEGDDGDGDGDGEPDADDSGEGGAE